MDYTAKTPFLYRFVGNLTLYGPRDLAFVVMYYGENSDCSAAPEREAIHEGAWRPAPEWRKVLAALPLTEEQAARLRRLGVVIDPERTSTAEAEALIQAATDAKPPTPALLTKAKELGIEVHSGVTRGALRAKVEAAEWDRDTADTAAELTEAGVVLPEGTSGDAVRAYAAAYEDLNMAIKYAKQDGFDLRPPDGLPATEIASLAAAIPEFVSLAGMVDDMLEAMQESGVISRIPRKSACNRALPWLLEVIRTAKWGSEGYGWEEFVLHAASFED